MSFLVSAQNAVDWDRRGVVTAVAQFFRTIGGTIGVAMLGARLNAVMTYSMQLMPVTRGKQVNPNDIINPHARSGMPPELLKQVQAALERGLHSVFVLLATGAVFAFLWIRLVLNRADAVVQERGPEVISDCVLEPAASTRGLE